MASISIDAVDGGSLDGVIVGGGNIIHAGPGVDRYRTDPATWLTSYARLWSDPASLALAHRIPLCWSAPGVPLPIPQRLRDMVQWATACASYLSVRDASSARNLRQAGVDGSVAVVPDTAFDVCELFTETELVEATRQLYARLNSSPPGRSFVVHLNQRYLGEPVEAVVRRIERIGKRLDASPVLIALGPCHGDAELVREAAASLQIDHIAVDAPQSLREIIGLISQAEVYVGSSLHGMITALALDRPGLVVAHEPEGGGKFSGQSEQLELHDVVVASWAEAEQRIEQVVADRRWAGAMEIAQSKLGPHWATLAESLDDGAKSPAGLDGQPSLQIVLEENASRAVDDALRARSAASQARKELATLQQTVRELKGNERRLRRELEGLRAQVKEAQRERDRVRAERSEAEVALRSVESSLSWRLTSPLRLAKALGLRVIERLKRADRTAPPAS